MSKTNVNSPDTNTGNSNRILEHAKNASIIYSPCSYQKYLPDATPETHKQFLQASGIIDYKPTNNYMFQGLFQEDTEALTNLICAILHWPRYKVKSIEITNPIVLGQYIENRTFILDIKVLLNDDTIINLEMQPNNYKNWPEFHAIYKMQNVKNHNIYTDKFILHVIELNNINLSTKEDHTYKIDEWASLFKATTWEDIHMLINDNPALQTAAETLYRLNMDERFREACERFAQAEIEHNSAIQRNITLTQINEELTQTNKLLTDELADKNAQIASLQAEISRLTEQNTIDIK